MLNISIIGTGYVGLVTGTCLASMGMHVLCFDTDEEKIGKLAKGILPIYEPGLKDLLKKCSKKRSLEFVSSMQRAVEASEIIFITVNTPTLPSNECDLTHVFEAAEGIAEHMNGYKIIVHKSTVPVGTGKRVSALIREKLSELGKQFPFDIVSNPEFLKEGSAVFDFFNSDRIVIGAESEAAIALMKEVYSDQILCKVPVITTSLETAEMIKYASNAFLAAKISFINEMAAVCEQCHADITEVARAMGMDRRIGRQFLQPGPGFGGSCFPKDVRVLAGIAEGCGVEPEMIRSILSVNKQQTDRMLSKIRNAVGDFSGKTITVLGISFKPGTDDIRESPAVSLIKKLHDSNAIVRVYDPHAMPSLKKEAPGLRIHYCRSAYTACSGSDCILLATEWNEFAALDFSELRRRVRKPVFLDLRNVYSPDYVKSFGFAYEGVGRK